MENHPGSDIALDFLVQEGANWNDALFIAFPQYLNAVRLYILQG